MKKKILLSLLCGVMVLGVATGCGNKENNNRNNNSANNPTVENNNNNSTTTGEITINSVKNAKVTDESKFDYREVEGGIAITDYEGTDEIVVIPETIDGQTVVAIDRNAVVNNDTMKGLKIANTVHTIGDHGFANCTELQIFVSGNSLKSIMDFAFNGCRKLREVELNNGLETIEMLSFGLTNLTQIEIPASVTTINMPFTKNEEQQLTIIGELGSEAENYVSLDGENFNIKFQVK